MRKHYYLQASQIIALLALITLLVGGTFAIYKKWWPWLRRNNYAAVADLAMDSNYRLHSIISDALGLVYYPHARKLLSYESNGTAVDNFNLGDLTDLPGTDDAFWSDFSRNAGRCLNESLPVDTLLASLNPKPTLKRKLGGRARMMRRTVGGLARFIDLDYSGNRYCLLVRYIGTYYPERATRAVGIVLNREWFIRQVPAIMDSLARESQAILFMAPAPPDTQWYEIDDPYRAQNNEWKETLGILDGKDTLWWYGDPNVRIGHAKGTDPLVPGYFVPIGPFGLDVLVSTEYPELQKEIVSGIKTIKWLLPTLIIAVYLALILLLLSFQWARIQLLRNRIALAHLAHSVKTPVARLKLVTDTLTTERVASPEEERALITAVGRECDRLDRAVQNAALSLQKGRRTYNITPGDLAATVREVAASWQPSFQQAGIILDVDANADGGKAMVNYDAAMIAVALDNLLDNSLRHTRLRSAKATLSQGGSTQLRSAKATLSQGGSTRLRSAKATLSQGGSTAAALHVRLSLQRLDNKAVISIDDMGGGIPKPQRKKIFKRFGRTSRDAATGATGLGLGLALVKEVVEAHQGSVRVEDSLLGGARIVIELMLN